MKTYLIALTSVTYALKAQKKLNGLGYLCDVQRTPRNLAKGCGYSIKVKGDITELCSLLDSFSIKYLATSEVKEYDGYD